jgi:hypothetical protein
VQEQHCGPGTGDAGMDLDAVADFDAHAVERREGEGHQALATAA